MGPNGSGKSTLSNIISGKPGYDIKEAAVLNLKILIFWK